jgi:hypothetical protein
MELPPSCQRVENKCANELSTALHMSRLAASELLIRLRGPRVTLLARTFSDAGARSLHRLCRQSSEISLQTRFVARRVYCRWWKHHSGNGRYGVEWPVCRTAFRKCQPDNLSWFRTLRAYSSDGMAGPLGVHGSSPRSANRMSESRSASSDIART